MWDTVDDAGRAGFEHLSHDMPCPWCGHARHSFLPCDEECGCDRAAVVSMPEVPDRRASDTA